MPKEHARIDAPNSIYHGMEIHSSNRRLPFSDVTMLKIEIGLLTDFIEFLFEHSEHCDHISQRDAWKEFKIHQAKNSFYRDNIKKQRAKKKEHV